MFHIDELIPKIVSTQRYDSIGEQDLGTRHGRTVPIEKGPRHMGHNSIVAHASQGYLKHRQAELKYFTISHAEIQYKLPEYSGTVSSLLCMLIKSQQPPSL